MGLFEPPITVVMNREEVKTFTAANVKPNPGGAQDFYHELAGMGAREGRLVLEDEQLLKVQRYAYAYGSGTYQNAFRAIVRAAWRCGWRGPEVKEGGQTGGRSWSGDAR
jgi:hypothetical protein